MWSSLLKNVRMYFRLFTHRDTPWYVKAILLTALLYLVVPTDFIPDWLLGFGIVDDLAIVSLLVGAALKLLGKDVDKTGKTGADERS
ncbi:MAG: DUF1232 domain-containing protein [Desulfocapsaceae bacterium]|jgi:uncharacterized membrane protein YkvA (DUF1232 family)|nr:DUF1232 domain-containing protein [Desulfocapsaceae bacterium]